MPATAHWGTTPRASVERECERRGTAAVVAGCVALLQRRDADDSLVLALGGPAARAVLDSGPAPVHRYWLRVWAARGLLYAWDDQAAGAVAGALGDESWRVREMAAKVAARHDLGDLLTDLAGLRDDPVPRVRTAASPAVAVLTARRA
jgi:hypothetical protein